MSALTTGVGVRLNIVEQFNMICFFGSKYEPCLSEPWDYVFQPGKKEKRDVLGFWGVRVSAGAGNSVLSILRMFTGEMCSQHVSAKKTWCRLAPPAEWHRQPVLGHLLC